MLSGLPLRAAITFTHHGRGRRVGPIDGEDAKPFRNRFTAVEIMSGSIRSNGCLARFGMTVLSVRGRTDPR